MTTHPDDQHSRRKKALVGALREMQTTDGWKLLTDELSKIRASIETRILDTPQGDIDNTLRYTKHDLIRETRRIVKNFMELPDDMVEQLEGSWEEKI